jgi:hypothetical protein
MNYDSGKHFKGRCRGLVEVLSRHLSGWTEDNYISQNVTAEIRTESFSNIILELYC